MTERVAEASPWPGARITGVVYLFYFLTAISAEVFVGQTRLVAYGVVNLIAYAFYISVTLLFYYLFKPVSPGLSFLAAFFSLLGCANDLLSLFHRAPFEVSSLFLFRALLLIDRLPHFQIHIPASDSGCAHGIGWSRLAPFSITSSQVSVDWSQGARLRCRNVADAMAHRKGSERSTVDRAGKRSKDAPISVSYHPEIG